MPLQHEQSAPLTMRGASVAVGHVGGGRRLIEEHEGVGVEIGHGVVPVLALGCHIHAHLLSRVQSPICNYPRV